jgi:hypothetical protein
MSFRRSPPVLAGPGADVRACDTPSMSDNNMTVQLAKLGAERDAAARRVDELEAARREAVHNREAARAARRGPRPLLGEAAPTSQRPGGVRRLTSRSPIARLACGHPRLPASFACGFATTSHSAPLRRRRFVGEQPAYIRPPGG